MELSTLCQEMQQGFYIFSDDMGKMLLELIPFKYSRKRELHYCWDSFRPLHRLELKIKPTNEFYKILWNEILETKRLVFLAIDADCLQGGDKLILIEIEKLHLILEKYYWELDEIYICDLKFEWLVAINHMFEFNFLGDGMIEFITNLMKDEKLDSCIITCAEYE